MNRVFITAVGVVSPIGTGIGEFLDGLHRGRRGIDRIRCFPTDGFPTSLGAEARERGRVIESAPGEDRKARFIRTALAEIRETGRLERYPPARRALHLGTGIDSFDFTGYVGRPQGTPWTDFSRRAHRVVADLAAELGFAGGHSANVSACVASTQALGLALRLLRAAPDLAVVTGGFDSMLSHLHYMGFYNLGALSTWDGEPAGACRPFDRRRCGLVIGEGAAALLLEGEAQARPETILCELAGYGATMDAYLVTDPEPSGRQLAAAALTAIRDAGLSPDDIDSVDLHGTGTLKNALAEARALALVFPQRWQTIPCFALKGQVGHLIGACGALEVLGVIDTLSEQRILPSANCEDPDPEVPLNIVRGAPLALPVRTILKLNAAFGGQNTALVLRRHG